MGFVENENCEKEKQFILSLYLNNEHTFIIKNKWQTESIRSQNNVRQNN